MEEGKERKRQELLTHYQLKEEQLTLYKLDMFRRKKPNSADKVGHCSLQHCLPWQKRLIEARTKMTFIARAYEPLKHGHSIVHSARRRETVREGRRHIEIVNRLRNI